MDPIKKTEEGNVSVLEIAGSIQHGDTPAFEEGIERVLKISKLIN